MSYFREITILTENEYNEVNLGNSNFKPYKEYLRERLYQEYSNKTSVQKLMKITGLSKSTIYNHIQTIRDKIMYPILKTNLELCLKLGDYKEYLRNLPYQDICLLGRKFRTYGYNKKDRISRLEIYLYDFSLLGLYPDNTLDKDAVKKAYKRKAKETHPDLNKNLSKNGLEFQEVHKAYTEILNKVRLYEL